MIQTLGKRKKRLIEGYFSFRQQKRRGKNRRARKGLRRNIKPKGIARSMLKTLETRRNRGDHDTYDGAILPPIARSRRSRNRHKLRKGKDRTDNGAVDEGRHLLFRIFVFIRITPVQGRLRFITHTNTTFLDFRIQKSTIKTQTASVLGKLSRLLQGKCYNWSYWSSGTKVLSS